MYNAHGDVTALANASGTITRNYDYDPFGNQRSVVDAVDSNPYRYCGEYYDTESGYTYLRARYYDPRIGRFISEDPALDGYNWYVYCSGDPVNKVDPTGLKAGDKFKSADDAAKDFAKEHYAITGLFRIEVCTTVYSFKSGIFTRYSYSNRNIGTPHSVNPNLSLSKEKKPVAVVHTHPFSNDFSADDKVYISNKSVNMYVVTPNKKLLHYNSFTKKTITVESNLSYRGLTRQEVNRYENQLRSKWYDHLSTCTVQTKMGVLPSDCHKLSWPNWN